MSLVATMSSTTGSNKLSILLAPLFLFAVAFLLKRDYQCKDLALLRQAAVKDKGGPTLNGFPLQYVDRPPQSSVHCIGENFDHNRSWMFRSCKFQTFCIDVSSTSPQKRRLDASNFVIYPKKPLYGPDSWWISTDADPIYNSVLAGGQITRWFQPSARKKSNITSDLGRFSPHMKIGSAVPSGYYRLPNVTLLPFFRHSVSFRNPGHLLWDDFLPIYTLLDIFDREEDRLLLAQMRRPRAKHFIEKLPPFDIITKFLPLLIGQQPEKYDIQLPEYHWELPDRAATELGAATESTVICADTALVGNGLFTDHGMRKWHGQLPSDYFTDPFNTGKGGLFRRFRKFLMRNIGVPPDDYKIQKPYRILFAQSSSQRKSRSNVTFSHHEEFVVQNFGKKRSIETVRPHLSAMTVKDQVEMISKTSIYFSTAGGSSSTALFLPKGANLILFYRHHQMLDFDFWNNYPHLKVHWLYFDRNETTGYWTHFPGEKFGQLVESILDCFEDETCD